MARQFEDDENRWRLSWQNVLMVLAGGLALVVVTWAASFSGNAVERMTPPRALDATRQILFVAGADGAVNVLDVRAGISQVAVLREQSRHAISTIVLDASGHWLWVQGDDALYRYDALSLRLLAREPGQVQIAEVRPEGGE